MEAGASGRAVVPSVDGAGGDVVGPPPAPVLRPPWEIRPVLPDGTEVERVQRWMGEPHVAAHWHQAWDRATWGAEIGRQLASAHSRPWTVWFDGEPLAYIEVYRAARDVIGRHVDADRHDLGIHLAIGDRRRTGEGLGPRLLRVVADGLFEAEPACLRVFGDPDAAHEVARRAFAAAGFEAFSEVELPHKRAALVVRRRAIVA